MSLEAKILDYLKQNLPEYRLAHTLGVRELAGRLAAHYDADAKKASLAALLHDVVRHLTNDELLKLARQSGMTVDEVEERAPYLLHAPLGAKRARELFGIDPEVCSAIRKHTLGDSTMTLLDKIIYLADWAEAGRTGESVEQVREWIFKDIDQAMLIALNATVQHLLNNNLLVHPQTIRARNAFIR